MKHYFTEIQGWFDFDDIYSAVVNHAPYDKESKFVEVGSWLGRSSSFMGVEIANSGKNIKFDCVDTWQGTDGEHNDFDVFKEKTIYETFLSNMEPVKDHFTPIRETSVDASKLYEDESLDFVFIDANHDYEPVLADVLSWLPKVKKGGIMAGHDWQSPSVRKGVLEVLPEQKLQISRFSWVYIVE